MSCPSFRVARALALVAAWSVLPAQSQNTAGPVAPSGQTVAPVDARTHEPGIVEWLHRIHQAPRKRAYIGTFVVSAGSNLSSARIWHVCDGEQQLVRVESLTGAPRSTFRRNDQVITFSPLSKTAVAEKRESFGMFPELLHSADSSIAQQYSFRVVGTERVAGLEADVVQLTPKDDLRFGYRVWSDKKTGLVVKLQTLGPDGKALEQAAFSELQLDAPVNMGKLSQMMDNTDGYRVERPETVKTTAFAEGWVLKNPVNGFKPTACFKRVSAGLDGQGPLSTLQWVFSDGLASVSIFVEPLDKRRHAEEGTTASGATNTLSRRVGDKSGEWWLTLVGEVPRQTLQAFALSLERRK